MHTAMLLLLLPLAMAACPCPTAPAASEKVCGTDLRTYPSQCDLECAAVPGLSVAHPGPCSAPGRQQGGASLVSSGTSAHPATEEKREVEECERQQCRDVTCSECGKDDKHCAGMCEMKCECGCSRLPAGVLDFQLWLKCYSERSCFSQHWKCHFGCEDNEECQSQCWLDHRQCHCGCQVLGGRQSSAVNGTSTERAATTSDTTPSDGEVQREIN